MRKEEKICSKCRKIIKERERFGLVYQRRNKYRTHWDYKEMELYFHKKCVMKIDVNVQSLWDLLVVMNKIEGKTNDRNKTI